MKDYLETVIEKTKINTTTQTEETNQMIVKAKEMLVDPKFINQNWQPLQLI